MKDNTGDEWPDPDPYPYPYPFDLIIPAWKEALAADGVDRIALVSLMVATTVLPALLIALWILAAFGVIA